MKKRFWTKQELELFKKGFSIQEIAEKTRRTENAVWKMKYRLMGDYEREVLQEAIKIAPGTMLSQMEKEERLTIIAGMIGVRLGGTENAGTI